VFLGEDDAGMPKTMMALDRGLTKTALWQERVGGAANILKTAGSLFGALLDNLQKRTPPSEDASSQRGDASPERSESLKKD
jgi:hypothetical protein